MHLGRKIVTFILGNGFDIELGLNTSYKDFYRWYLTKNDVSEDYSKMREQILRYMDGENPTWEDYELALGQLTNDFDDPEMFKRCFLLAKEALVAYIKKQYSEECLKNRDYFKSAAYRLIEVSQEMAPIEPKDGHIEFNCISLNYTPLFHDGKDDFLENEQLVSRSSEWLGRYRLGEMINVHGTFDNPILGVDNVDQIANKEFRKNQEIVNLMVKGEIDKNIGQGWRENAVRLILKSDKIYVLGASMGDTDEFWWKTLAEWVESRNGCCELVLNCRPDTDKEKQKQKVERFRKKISNHLLNKGFDSVIQIEETKRSMRVTFVRISATNKIQTYSRAKLSVIPAGQLDS